MGSRLIYRSIEDPHQASLSLLGGTEWCHLQVKAATHFYTEPTDKDAAKPVTTHKQEVMRVIPLTNYRPYRRHTLISTTIQMSYCGI